MRRGEGGGAHGPAPEGRRTPRLHGCADLQRPTAPAWALIGTALIRVTVAAAGWEKAAAGFSEIPKGKSAAKIWLNPAVSLAPSCVPWVCFPFH
eukprot:scaffold24175_cov125-Isochrysis_galbana.AAC.9